MVGVRKNMMLLFENKLSYIFCVVGAGVTNAEWALWFVKLNQRRWLACWFVYLCVIFYHVLCEIWINYLVALLRHWHNSGTLENVSKDGIIHDFSLSWLSSLWNQLCQNQASTGPMLLASDWYQSCSGTLRHVNKGNIILNFGAFWM